MQEVTYITVISNRKKITLKVATILYVIMRQKNAEIHVAGGAVYVTRESLNELEKQLGEAFIKIHRGCLVSVMAIHDITDNINLSNGECLGYTIRKKKWITEELYARKKQMVGSFVQEGIPQTEEEYRSYYASFEQLPFAFTDIEMVFDEDRHALDWIFKYGNARLAELERLPLEQLIGNSFGSLFSNMDSKWLRAYERAALFGETLELMEYSPEVDRYLKIICFPTFKGHCGCMLFDLADVMFTRNSDETQGLWMRYLGNQADEF